MSEWINELAVIVKLVQARLIQECSSDEHNPVYQVPWDP